MSWKKLEQAADKGPGALMWWLIPRALFVVLLITISFVFLNPLFQSARIINKTIDADNVIHNYEWFKMRHESIIAIEKKITDAKAAVDAFSKAAGERKNWDREDKIEFSRLQLIHLGLTQQRADMAAEYNAKSRMVNRNIFKSGDVDLPERISE